MSNKDSLGDRMKEYENISRIYLTKKLPIIIRIDGKAFHSFTRGFQRPFDDILISTMQQTTRYLCANIMGCKLAYTQSDEISLLLVDYERNETQSWFESNLQKMVSVAMSMATMAFNKFFVETLHPIDSLEPKLANTYYDAINKGAMFDARAFVIPKEEVCNYFIWRQQDASRNSIQMVAQSIYSHTQMQNKSCDVLQEMMFQDRQINWNDFDTVYKRGSCITKEYYTTQEGVMRSEWIVDKNIPVFTQNRSYVDRFVFPEKDSVSLNLPCKVGTTVYCVQNGEIVNKTVVCYIKYATVTLAFFDAEPQRQLYDF